MQLPPLEFRVVGQQRMEGQLEEAVQGTSSGIDSRYSRRCEHDMLLFRRAAYIFQKRGFSRPCLAREEDRLPGILYQLECVLKFGVVRIYLYVLHHVIIILLGQR